METSTLEYALHQINMDKDKYDKKSAGILKQIEDDANKRIG